MSENTQDGMIIEGSDHAIYFIPADRLDEFRLDTDAAASAVDSLQHMEEDVAGFTFTTADFGLQPGVSPLRAFEGPLGERIPDGPIVKASTMYKLPRDM